MAPDVTIKAIEFKEHIGYGAVGFVQFLLSNGDKSPIFKTGNEYFENQKTINLDSVNRPVRAISACNLNSAFVYKIKF